MRGTSQLLCTLSLGDQSDHVEFPLVGEWGDAIQLRVVWRRCSNTRTAEQSSDDGMI